MGPLIDLLPLPYTDAVVLTGAVLLGVASAVLGAFAVLRGRSLVGDALAHAALPGVCLAFLLTGVKDPSSLLVGAAVAGVIGALVIVALERVRRIRPGAAIGVVLSSFFSLGIVLLTAIASANDSDQAGLERYLFGQAAGLLERDVRVMGALAAAALLVVAALFRPLKATLFDPAFAGATGLRVRALEVAMTALLVVAVVIGLRTVGAILMVSLLVAPTVAARQLAGRLAPMLAIAALAGGAAGGAGALLSARAEVPTGPVIVLLAVGVAIASVVLAPGRGVLSRARRLARDRRRTLVDALLVDLDAMEAPTLTRLAAVSNRPARDLARAVRAARRDGLLRLEGERLLLPYPGQRAAVLARARRALWSAWLEHGWRLDLADAREPDPTDLRGSLGDAAADRLKALSHA